MAAVPQKVLNWLHGALRNEYRDVNRTYSDVAQTLSYNPNFTLRTDVYTYENGHSSLLLNVAGTLPVSFRGTTYMFPVSLWVPHEYPRAVPIAFVTPTKNMAVRPGQYVSGEGRIYHPYLAAWRQDRSNLSEFLSILQEVFAREPPVITKEEQMPQPVPPRHPNGAPPPVPPLPPELERSDTRISQARAASGFQPGPPPPPPKPYSSQGGLQSPRPDGAPPLPPLPTQMRSQHVSMHGNYENGYTSPSRPKPQFELQRANSLQNQTNRASYQQRPHTPPNQQPRQDSFSPVSPITPPFQQRRFLSNTAQPPQSQYNQQRPPPASLANGAPPPGPMDPSWSEQQQLYRQQPQRPPQQQPGQSHPQQYHPPNPQQPPKPKPPEDLLTSPFETALPTPAPNIAPPPIPPNPQKDAILNALSQSLTQQVQQTFESNQAALPPLRAQQAALTNSLNAINKEISQLNDLEALLSSNEAVLHQAMRDADKVLEDAKHRKVPNVDEVLVAPTVVAGQLYELVADERSLEDCRAVVGRALDRGRIRGDVWAKQTRSLAREEFLKKALIKKVAKGMGLATEERWG